jgi:hypothetical protein
MSSLNLLGCPVIPDKTLHTTVIENTQAEDSNMKSKKTVQQNNRWLIMALSAALPLIASNIVYAGGGKSIGPDTGVHPATVEATSVPGIKRITLTERGAKRTGITLDKVKSGNKGLEIPYAALLYQADGSEWVYIAEKPLVYVRVKVHVTDIKGNTMFVSEGPVAGTEVVTTGGIELLGTEFDIGH